MFTNWINLNKKEIVIHSLIIGSFIVYIHCSEVIISNIANHGPGPKVISIHLPDETNNFKYNIDSIKKNELHGWAFLPEQDSKKSKTYLALKSQGKSYLIETRKEKRDDVKSAFELNSNNVGFTTQIPDNKIKNGLYRIGIYIESLNNTKSLTYSKYSVIKTDSKISIEKNPKTFIQKIQPELKAFERKVRKQRKQLWNKAKNYFS